MPKLIRNRNTFIRLGELSPQHQSAKNTRKWCRGKPGVPHDWRWVSRESVPNQNHFCFRADLIERIATQPVVCEVLVCAGCGKQQCWGEGRRYVHRGCGGVMVTIQSETDIDMWERSLFECVVCHVRIARKDVV